MSALTTPSTEDGPRFHMNVPISELIERDTRADEASVVSSAPPVVETEDGVTRETWPAPIRPQGARGLELLDLRSRDRGLKATRKGSEVVSRQTRARGENADEPQRPLPNPH